MSIPLTNTYPHPFIILIDVITSLSLITIETIMSDIKIHKTPMNRYIKDTFIDILYSHIFILTISNFIIF